MSDGLTGACIGPERVAWLLQHSAALSRTVKSVTAAQRACKAPSTGEGFVLTARNSTVSSFDPGFATSFCCKDRTSEGSPCVLYTSASVAVL